MPSSLDYRVQAVDEGTLTPLVRQVLARSTGSVTYWKVEQAQLNTFGGGMGSSVIYRFSGLFQEHNNSIPWSLILKVVLFRLESDEADLPERNDFRREVEFYRSDLAHQLPPGFRAAHCYNISEEKGDEGQIEYWLWLEALVTQDTSLTLEDYYLLAQGLGLLNGVFLVDHPLPSAPWLDSEGIRKYLERATPVVNQLFENRTLTLVQRVFPPDAIDSFVELWHSRQQHLQTLSRLPQTLCHGDAQVSNLFLHSRPSAQPETVAIDWTQVGLGAIGCDLGQLISFSLGTGKVDFALADALDQAIFQGYLAGLNTAGWQGDPRVVRLGYTAAALKSRTTVVIRSLPSLIDERVHRQVEQRLKSQGLAFDNILETVFHSALFLEKLFHESLELRDQLL